MKTITDLKPQLKNNKRVSVYLNGSYYCGLNLATVMQARLKVGMEIDETTLIDIQKNSEAQACFDSALNFISKSVKTERQIKDKLISKGYIEEIVLEVIEKLKSYNFINDQNYAERFVLTYSNYKGKRLLKTELKLKGVSETVINDALIDIDSEFETALKIAQKYSKNKQKDKKNFAKCYNHLISKGFSYDDAMSATKKAFENLDID